MAKVYIETISSSLYSRALWDETGVTNYVVGDRVSLNDSLFSNAGGTIDDSHNRVYICIADNNSTTHPFDDPTNWVLAGSSEEYPSYAVDGSICTNSMNNEVYLEREASRYSGKGSNRFTWNQATVQGTEHGELIFADGEYHDDSKGFSVDRLNFTAKNTGKVSITTVGQGSCIFQGSNINLPETTDISTHTGIKFIIAGNKDLQHHYLALAFHSCVITDRDSSVGTYSASSFRLGTASNFLNLKNTLIDLPNSTIALMGYNMTLFKGQKSLWENSTIYSSAGNGNQYLPMFYSNTSNLSVKKCIFAFTTSLYNPDNWSLNFPDDSSDNLVYVYDQSAKQPAEEAGLTIQDPLFINPAQGDFRLRPSSVLVGGLQSSSKQSKLESQYPNGKWFDSQAAAGGDGSWETPYNNYGEAINSFTGDEAVVLIKEGQHQLLAGCPNSSGSFDPGNDLSKVYSNGIKFIGMGSGSIFDTSSSGIKNFGAFWSYDNNNPNSGATPFLFKDFDILLNNSGYLNRGLICARRAEYINVNVTQALNLGASNSQLFDYTTASGSNSDSGEYLKMSGCTVNVSLSRNSSNTAFLVGSSGGLKQYSNCTFVDLNRTTSMTSTPPSQFAHTSFGVYPGSYIKDCIIYANNSLTTMFGNQYSSGDLDVKNVVVYNAHIATTSNPSVSVSNKWSDNVTVVNPKFIATEPHDFDLRLRPDSPAIGGIKTEPTNVYYLQPGNPFNGDGSQKDASSMTADGDPGPFNEFKEIVAAGVPYGSTIVILNGTYDWTQSFGRSPSTNVATNTWQSYTCAGYNYVAETMHGVIFDAKHDTSNVFIYKPYGGTPGAGVFLDLDTTFTGVQFNNMIGTDNSTRNTISSVSGSAGLGSCTFRSCKFLGNINRSNTSYPWTGGGRSMYSSTMHWENCEISIAFDEVGSLLGGGDGFADDAYHGAWSWKNCTFYIASGITTFNGRNAANGTYVSPSLIFGTNYKQSQRVFKNNIIQIENGTASIGVNSSDKLPNVSNNCFNGVSPVYSTTDHSAALDAKNNLFGVNPAFVDPSSSNFALRPLSSLIGQGK